MATSGATKGTTITAALKKQATVLNKELLQATNELVDNSAKTVGQCAASASCQLHRASPQPTLRAA